ncbi:MAG TPA: UPF0182 family protein [Syntrophales bacterium]|nr:UPF0182 family protein [Syntrophales bacterium]HRT61748.1 UPF0182 family protein [Syntrophales bacterium]
MNRFRIPKPGIRNIRGLSLFVLLFGLLVVFRQAVGFIADWLWFNEVGYQSVFVTTLKSQMTMAAVFGLAFFVFLYANLFIAFRVTSRLPEVEAEPLVQGIPLNGKNPAIQTTILAFCLLFGAFAALNATGQWENYLRFFNAVPFGVKDPVFQRDIGFYVFKLPLLNYLFGWFLILVIITTIATGVAYLSRKAFILIPPRTWRAVPAARAHLTILVALLFFWGIFGFWLTLNEILFAKRGVVFGPGYTEITTQLWVLKALMGLCFLTGASIIGSLFLRDVRIPALAIILFLILFIFGRGLYPAFVQRFKVIPNEIVLEKPYLERNIQYTRMAYQLDLIEERDFFADESLNREDLRRNDLTIKNVRLWNDAPLLQTYGQLQEIRTYYKFVEVDNDRYMINGEYRQVMLSPRELSYQALPSRTWVNEHLTYTHGYGVVVGPVNRVTTEGLPEFFIKDIPPVSSANLRITRPEIYYGETSNDYVFVRTKAPEFDYPVGDKNVYSKYEGKGGVPLSFLRKLLFAARFGSVTILLANEITDESRIMYYRKARERVARIAPFAHLESDPYLVISPEGRLLWFVDGYTVTNRFPYSEPLPGGGNYLRNSIKAIVDAYDGSVDIYISDATDPIIQTYDRIFPGVFKPLEAIPEGVRDHIRYPGGMLGVQAHMFRAYHMEDPQVFYNKEDLWAIPGKPGRGGEQEMDPYYTIMRLPGEKKEEFIMLVPFTPSRKDNMAAWMAARCDIPNYGKLIVYQFPKQRLIYGPRQIDARIDQDAEISKQLSLWNQRGSSAIRGSLLAIPIEKSILYIQPLYLSAEKGQLPELKRVIVAFGNSIAMEETLELSLQRIFGGELIRDKGARPAAAAPVARQKADRELALEALQHYRRAQEHMKQGNWAAYGEELRKMDEALRSVERRK